MADQSLFHAFQEGLKETSANITSETFHKFSIEYKKLTSLSRKVRRAMQKKWKHSLAVIALALALGGTPAMGVDFNVNGGNVGDLIDAINTANGNGVADNIILDGSTFTLNDPYNMSANGLPVISSDITIQGNGSTIERVADNATNPFRIFEVDENGIFTLQEITLTGGFIDDAGINDGGAIFLDSGEVTIEDSVITDNEADDDGGGIATSGNNSQAVLTVTNSSIADNIAGDSGGGIYSAGSTIITITNSTISGNEANNGDGGGIYLDTDPGGQSNITIESSTISDNNSDDDGGGIFNRENLEITNSTISGNMATGDGAGINNEGGTIEITGSIISGNTLSFEGGGIYNDDGTITITNSTISGNETNTDGGGIYNGGMLTITNSTISENTAGENGGGIVNVSTLNIQNTIVSGNTADELGNNCYDEGTLNDNGNNLSETAEDCEFGMSPEDDVDPMIGPLADNGGPTQTHALLSGSPAINNAGSCPPPDEDQRGIMRPQDGSCDIGAFEFIDQNNNNIDDCVDTDFFADIDGDGISDFCDAFIGDRVIEPAPTMSQWGMIAFGFIAGLFGLRFLRQRKEQQTSF